MIRRRLADLWLRAVFHYRAVGIRPSLYRSLRIDLWLPRLLRGAGEPSLPAQPRGGGLIIDWRLPVHDQNAGSQRMYWIVKIMRDLGVPLTFLPHDLAPVQPYLQQLEDLGVHVAHGEIDRGYFIHDIAPNIDFVFVNYADLMDGYLPWIKRFGPDLVTFFDTVDLHFLREGRRAEHQGASDDKAGHYREMELRLVRECTATVVVTEREKALVQAEVPEATIHVIPTIHEVRPPKTPFEGREGLFFVGSFPYLANGDAMVWFVREVLSLVQAELGPVKLHIVGPEPAQDVLDLAREDVIVHGWQADLTPFHEGCRVFVAPILWGAGMKGKVAESMGCGLPVAGTTLAFEGLGVTDGEHVLAGDTPAALADAVTRLYTDAALWSRLSAASMSHVASHYTPEVIAPRVRAMLAAHGLLGG